jgi:hypothetical protein
MAKEQKLDDFPYLSPLHEFWRGYSIWKKARLPKSVIRKKTRPVS